MTNGVLKFKLDFLAERKRELLFWTKKIKNVKPNSEEFFKILQKMVQLKIEIKGHAWCMDVESERKKMARLILNFVVYLKKDVKIVI